MQLFLRESELKLVKMALDSFTRNIAKDRTEFADEINLVLDENVADAEKLKLYIDSLLSKK